VALTVSTPRSTVTSIFSGSTPGTSNRSTSSPSRRTVSIGRPGVKALLAPLPRNAGPNARRTMRSKSRSRVVRYIVAS
jgi:hypothetical protein